MNNIRQSQIRLYSNKMPYYNINKDRTMMLTKSSEYLMKKFYYNHDDWL